jgi:hypothetical protein
MLFKEIITVYCENHAEPINKPYRWNAELFNIKPSGTQNYHWTLKRECYLWVVERKFRTAICDYGFTYVRNLNAKSLQKSYMI